MLLKLECINDGLQDNELFDDAPFWNLPDDAFDIGSHHSDQRKDSKFYPVEGRLSACDSCKYPKVCQCSLKTPNKDEDKTVEENGPYLTMNI